MTPQPPGVQSADGCGQEDEMTKDEMNAKIAEFCEPYDSIKVPVYTLLGIIWLDSPGGFWSILVDRNGEKDHQPKCLSTDRNAMAQAEAHAKVMTVDYEYIHALADIVDPEAQDLDCVLFEIATATATQRATALCRVIDGEG